MLSSREKFRRRDEEEVSVRDMFLSFSCLRNLNSFRFCCSSTKKKTIRVTTWGKQIEFSVQGFLFFFGGLIQCWLNSPLPPGRLRQQQQGVTPSNHILLSNRLCIFRFWIHIRLRLEPQDGIRNVKSCKSFKYWIYPSLSVRWCFGRKSVSWNSGILNIIGEVPKICWIQCMWDSTKCLSVGKGSA